MKEIPNNNEMKIKQNMYYCSQFNPWGGSKKSHATNFFENFGDVPGGTFATDWWSCLLFRFIFNSFNFLYFISHKQIKTLSDFAIKISLGLLITGQWSLFFICFVIIYLTGITAPEKDCHIQKDNIFIFTVDFESQSISIVTTNGKSFTLFENIKDIKNTNWRLVCQAYEEGDCIECISCKGTIKVGKADEESKMEELLSEKERQIEDYHKEKALHVKSMKEKRFVNLTSIYF